MYYLVTKIKVILMRTVCPKCSSINARYVRDGADIVLRCLCGYHKVVATQLESIQIEHRDTKKEVTLPKQGSKLWYCLLALSSITTGRTDQIHSAMNRLVVEQQTMSEVSSQLTVLRYKGLVEVTENRKGTAGGSTWVLTDVAKKLTGTR